MSSLYETAFAAALRMYDGTPEQATEELLQGLCICTVDLLRSRLRAGVSETDCSTNLTQAAGMLALSVLHTLELGDGNLSALDAGTLSLRFDQSHDRLAQLARELIAPWCDGGMAFVGVVV